MDDAIPESWRAVLAPVLAAPEARALAGWLDGEEATGKAIYPPRDQRLAALALTPLESVRCVILGQDPYHGPGQAHGLAFSARGDTRLPPSLVNIYKELESDLGVSRPAHGDLTAWAQQGVLLLNSTLSVEGGTAGSHAGRGWEAITDACVAAVAQRPAPSAFILWGSQAQAKAKRIPALREGGRHLLVESPHPSPLSAYRGFFGSRPFSRVNAFLRENGRGTVDWRLQG